MTMNGGILFGIDGGYGFSAIVSTMLPVELTALLVGFGLARGVGMIEGNKPN